MSTLVPSALPRCAPRDNLHRKALATSRTSAYLNGGPKISQERKYCTAAHRVYSSAVEEFETPEDVSNTVWWERISVEEIMTPNPLMVSPDTSVFKALEILTENSISGIAVVEDSGEVIGVVSAYDILALDSTPGQLDKSDGFFPPIGRCHEDFGGDEKAMWRSFFSLRNGIIKAQASKVVDSMHDTYCVLKTDSLSKAADLIVRKNTQRVFVLDAEGKVCGVLTRGDILRITMEKYREIKQETH